MVRRQGKQHLVDQEDMLKVVDDALSIQEVHGRSQEVPVQRLGKPDILLFTRGVGNGDDLLERDYLHRRHNANDVDVAGEHGNKEKRYHHERPYRPGNESLPLLLVLGQCGFLGFLLDISAGPGNHRDTSSPLPE